MFHSNRAFIKLNFDIVAEKPEIIAFDFFNQATYSKEQIYTHYYEKNLLKRFMSFKKWFVQLKLNENVIYIKIW